MWFFIVYFLFAGIVYSICQDFHMSVGESFFAAMVWPITVSGAVGIAIAQLFTQTFTKKKKEK